MRTWRRIAACFGLPALLLFTACPDDPPPAPKDQRLVIVFDPTVLRDVTPADFRSRVASSLRASMEKLPEDTFVDLYLVQMGGTGLPVDLRGSLPFDENDPTGDEHVRKAAALGDSVARVVESRWAASNEEPNRPSSCILTALYRAQEMVKEGKQRGEEVTLVVISDLLEACPELGPHNFERVIPDSLAPVGVDTDLSGADRVLMLRVQTTGTMAPLENERLIRLWTGVLKRWKVDETKIKFASDFPPELVEVPGPTR